MINLTVDRLAAIPTTRASDIGAAIVAQPQAYTEAAARIGLTVREYREFRLALAAGGATFVRRERWAGASRSPTESTFTFPSAAATSRWFEAAFRATRRR